MSVSLCGTTQRRIAQDPKLSTNLMRTSDLIIQYTRRLLTFTIWLLKPVYGRQQYIDIRFYLTYLMRLLSMCRPIWLPDVRVTAV